MRWRQPPSAFENNQHAERFVRSSRVSDHDLANCGPGSTKATEKAVMPERHCCHGKMEDRVLAVRRGRRAAQCSRSAGPARLMPSVTIRCSRSGYASPSCNAAAANSSTRAISGLGLASM